MGILRTLTVQLANDTTNGLHKLLLLLLLLPLVVVVVMLVKVGPEDVFSSAWAACESGIYVFS